MTAGAIAIGAAAGVIAGMLGVGGGVLFVPGLVFLVGLGQHEAEATSLLAIIPVAIVGVLKRPLKEGETIEPENFVRNKVFNDFLHEFIASHGPDSEGLRAEARRQGEGCVRGDLRTRGLDSLRTDAATLRLVLQP